MTAFSEIRDSELHLEEKKREAAECTKKVKESQEARDKAKRAADASPSDDALRKDAEDKETLLGVEVGGEH